jgi:hypothetical protein
VAYATHLIQEGIMARLLSGGIVAVASVLVGWSALRTNPDARKLLSAQDAQTLVGPPLALTHNESNATFSTCVYSRPNQNPLAVPEHVEIHYWLLTDSAAAQARFQRIVHPGPMAGTTVTAVSQLGDEADIKRTPNLKVNSIEFRRGAAVVTIGVNPIVSDSALKAAGRTALSRL